MTDPERAAREMWHEFLREFPSMDDARHGLFWQTFTKVIAAALAAQYQAGVEAERARWATVPHVYGHGYYMGSVEVLIAESLTDHNTKICADLGGQCAGESALREPPR